MVMINLILVQYTNLFHLLSIQNLILSDWGFLIVCPDGFFGDVCSVSCIFPQYGSLCSETCNCSNAFCHHVYGCNTTIVTKSGRFFLILKQNIDLRKFYLNASQVIFRVFNLIGSLH